MVSPVTSPVTQPAYLSMAGFQHRQGDLGSRVSAAEQAGDGVSFVLFVSPNLFSCLKGKDA